LKERGVKKEKETFKKELAGEVKPTIKDVLFKIIGKPKAGAEVSDLMKHAMIHEVDKYTKTPPTGAVARAKFESDKFKAAVKIWRNEDIEEDIKKRLITETLGESPEDITYYDTAVAHRSVRRVAVDEVFESAGWEGLISLRREVNNKRILTNTIITDMVDEGIIDYETGKYLKKVEWVKDKLTGEYKPKYTGKGTKAKKIKLPAGLKPTYTTPKIAKVSAGKAPSISLKKFKITVRKKPKKPVIKFD